MEWKRGIHFLNGLWVKFKDFFLTIATDAFYGAVALLAEAWAGLQVAWVETTAFLGNVWTKFTKYVVKAWNKVQGWLAKRWVEILGFFDETIDVEAVEAEEPGAINDLFVKLGWRPTRSPDDLTAIKGIGKRYCDRLYSAGVYTFAELAATDPEELRQAARVMRTVDIESWRRQAHELAVEFDREDVRYFGPRPNDLTAIKGITPQIMRRLYQRGIVTYTQLARLSERQLAENLAGLGVAESPDLRTWLVKAAELSRARLAPPQGGDQ